MKVMFEFPGDQLPEHCYDCPLHDSENGACKLDGRSSEWRPFWCPLQPMPVSNRAIRHPILGDVVLTEEVDS